MKRLVSPAPTILPIICVALVFSAAAIGCKARPPVDTQQNGTTNGTVGLPPDAAERMARMERELRAVRTERDDLVAERDEATDQLQTLQTEMATLRGSVGEHSQQVQALRGQIAERSSRITQLETNLREKDRRIGELERERQSARQGATMPAPAEIPSITPVERPEVPSGYQRHESPGGAISFDFPAEWSLKRDVGADFQSVSYIIVSPDGAVTVRITFWNYLKEAPFALATQLFSTAMSSLDDAAVEQDVQAEDAPIKLIAEQDSFSAHVSYAREDQRWFRQFAAANLSTEADVYWTVLIEMNYDATARDSAGQAFDSIARSIFVAGE